MRVQNLVPAALRLELRRLRRACSDYKNRTTLNFAMVRCVELSPSSIATTQPIKGRAFRENKLSNIRLSAALVERFTIFPDEVFSFWRSVGRPSKPRGFKKGRTLRAGKVMADLGGGLCQLSGIIYHTALKANLRITERYNHSLDIYQEEERFATLGSDATVAFAYKDLRFCNTTNQPISFRFKVESDELTCELLSLEPILETRITFVREECEGLVKVNTVIQDVGDVIARSLYKKKDIGITLLQ